MIPDCNIHDEVVKWDKEHFNVNKRIDNIIEKSDANELQVFNDLRDLIECMDNCHELREKYPESYLKAKFHRKKIALNPNKISIKNKSDAFYDWLKVCINLKHVSKINFYFERHDPPLFKEDEIKTILFENGELREIFKKDDWQIRLKKIKLWFLKRYDFKTSYQIHKNLTNRRKSEFIDFVPLRLFCAILAGFLPLIFKPDIWAIDKMIVTSYSIMFSVLLIILTFLFFIYDCSKVIDNKKINISIRVIPVFLEGLIFSLIPSVILYVVFLDTLILPMETFKYLAFLGTIAYFIGIIVQIIWQDNTAVEPL